MAGRVADTPAFRALPGVRRPAERGGKGGDEHVAPNRTPVAGPAEGGLLRNTRAAIPVQAHAGSIPAMRAAVAAAEDKRVVPDQAGAHVRPGGNARPGISLG